MDHLHARGAAMTTPPSRGVEERVGDRFSLVERVEEEPGLCRWLAQDDEGSFWVTVSRLAADWSRGDPLRAAEVLGEVLEGTPGVLWGEMGDDALWLAQEVGKEGIPGVPEPLWMVVPTPVGEEARSEGGHALWNSLMRTASAILGAVFVAVVIAIGSVLFEESPPEEPVPVQPVEHLLVGTGILGTPLGSTAEEVRRARPRMDGAGHERVVVASAEARCGWRFDSGERLVEVRCDLGPFVDGVDAREARLGLIHELTEDFGPPGGYEVHGDQRVWWWEDDTGRLELVEEPEGLVVRLGEP